MKKTIFASIVMLMLNAQTSVFACSANAAAYVPKAEVKEKAENRPESALASFNVTPLNDLGKTARPKTAPLKKASPMLAQPRFVTASNARQGAVSKVYSETERVLQLKREIRTALAEISTNKASHSKDPHAQREKIVALQEKHAELHILNPAIAKTFNIESTSPENKLLHEQHPFAKLGVQTVKRKTAIKRLFVLRPHFDQNGNIKVLSKNQQSQKSAHKIKSTIIAHLASLKKLLNSPEGGSFESGIPLFQKIWELYINTDELIDNLESMRGKQLNSFRKENNNAYDFLIANVADNIKIACDFMIEKNQEYIELESHYRRKFTFKSDTNALDIYGYFNTFENINILLSAFKESLIILTPPSSMFAYSLHRFSQSVQNKLKTMDEDHKRYRQLKVKYENFEKLYHQIVDEKQRNEFSQ